MLPEYLVEPKKCATPSCENMFRPHYWGTVKARGWFHQKNGNSYCPTHKPTWVDEWRARKAEKKERDGLLRGEGS